MSLASWSVSILLWFNLWPSCLLCTRELTVTESSFSRYFSSSSFQQQLPLKAVMFFKAEYLRQTELSPPPLLE